MATKNKTSKEQEKIISIKFFTLLGILTVITLIGIILLFKGNKAAKTDAKKEIESILPIINREGIAIIYVDGVIQFNYTPTVFGTRNYGASAIVSKIQQYAKSDKVKGIILRVNSPGGTIGSVQEIYDALQDFRSAKKIVVTSMGDIAASGGYYIASASDWIIANPGTITGSIGVIISSPSFQSLFNKIGIDYRVFKSGQYKDILSPYRKIDSEEKRLIQSVVDNAYQQFFQAVKQGRNFTTTKLKQYADGRIFTGAQAKELGFVDELGGLNKAIKVIGRLTGLGKNPYIIREKVNLWEQLLNSATDKKSLVEKLIPLNNTYVPIYYLYQK